MLTLSIQMLGLIIMVWVGADKIERAIDRNTTATAEMFTIPSCKLEGK